MWVSKDADSVNLKCPPQTGVLNACSWAGGLRRWGIEVTRDGPVEVTVWPLVPATYSTMLWLLPYSSAAMGSTSPIMTEWNPLITWTQINLSSHMMFMSGIFLTAQITYLCSQHASILCPICKGTQGRPGWAQQIVRAGREQHEAEKLNRSRLEGSVIVIAI